ncbi:MAG: PD-(D/E)XK nuclease family protein, partial [Synergistaceae bacterium]|nr:PD-(D/E)XK nuclease family protein [Synergistaceae bacterium]
APEYYEFQLEFYAYAIWKHKGCPSDLSVDAGLYYLRERECRRKLFKGGDFVKFGDEIHVAATEALSGVFNKAESRCSSCPWSKECGKK